MAVPLLSPGQRPFAKNMTITSQSILDGTGAYLQSVNPLATSPITLAAYASASFAAMVAAGNLQVVVRNLPTLVGGP